MTVEEWTKPVTTQKVVEIAAARKMNAIATALKADPTLDRKQGERTDLKKELPYDHKEVQRVYGDNPEYLSQRIAETRPDIHERLKRGEYPSVRKAAIEAGVVKPLLNAEVLAIH